MSTRALIIGIVVILLAGAAGALLIRSQNREPEPASQDSAGLTLYDDTLSIPEPQPRRAMRTLIFDDSLTAEPELLAVGSPAPDFSLEQLDGSRFRLSDHRGETVLINFWATWCAPCREEMPALQQVHERSDDVTVVGVSLDVDGRTSVEEFHATFPVGYPLLLNGVDVAVRYAAHYAVPTTYVVGPEGRIRDRWVGALELEEILQRLDGAR